MGPRAHLKPRGNPFQTDRRFRSQSAGNPNLTRIAFPAPPEFGVIPTTLLEFVPHDPLGLRRTGLLPVAGCMAFASLALGPLQDPLAKFGPIRSRRYPRFTTGSIAPADSTRNGRGMPGKVANPRACVNTKD